MEEIVYRGKDKQTGKYQQGCLYTTDDGRQFILPKSTLWRTESDGDDMRSVYVAYEVYPFTLAMWNGKKDKYGTKIFMACHNGHDKYKGADILVRGGYKKDPNVAEDRAEALGYPTSLAFDGHVVTSRGHWTPEDWEASTGYWGVIEVVGIHP